MVNKNDQQPSGLFQHLEYSSVGIEMGLSIAGGALLGYYLDQWLGTDPWMLFIWFFCGIGAGFRALYRTLQKLKSDQPSESQDTSDEPDQKKH